MSTIWNETHTWSTGKKENKNEDEDHAAVRQPGDLTLQEQRGDLSRCRSSLVMFEALKYAERCCNQCLVTC